MVRVNRRIRLIAFIGVGAIIAISVLLALQWRSRWLKAEYKFPALDEAKRVEVYLPGGGETRLKELSDEDAATFREIVSTLRVEGAPTDSVLLSGVLTQCFRAEVVSGMVDVGSTGQELVLDSNLYWPVNRSSLSDLDAFYRDCYDRYY